MLNNEKIKYFDKEFCPMVVPVLEGIYHLENIENDLFPIYAAPYVDGVDIVIRHGLVCFNETGEVIRNMYFNQRFYDLIEVSRKFRYTIHCKVKSRTIKNEVVKEQLNHSLPNDLKLYVTDVVMDPYFNKMQLLSRVGNMTIISSYVKNRYVEILKPMEVLNKKELLSVSEIYVVSNTQYSGVTLFKDKGEYQQGFVEAHEANVVSISFKQKLTYRIISMDVASEHYHGNPVKVATKLWLHSSGSDLVPIDLREQYPLVLRHQIYNNLYNYMSREVIFEAMILPNFKSPKFRTLIEII